MQWSDVIAAPPERHLRQFSGLFVVIFLALGGWRIWQGQADWWATTLVVLALGVGLVGLARPSAVRFIYTGWMIVAFPIGWTVSRIALAIVFFVVVTPMALVFRAVRRDELRLRRDEAGASYWRAKPSPKDVREYFRQT